MKWIQKYIVVGIMLFTSITIAQVGVNTTQPNKHAALHVSESGNETSIKGIVFPRVTQTQLNQLTYVDPLNPTTVKLTASDDGLYVFNTTVGCFSFWNNSIRSWENVCDTDKPASFTVDCSTSKIYGVFEASVPLNTSNYIIAQVNVTQIGYYHIQFKSNNGYDFYASGFFPEVGTYSLVIKGEGVPQNSTSTGLDLLINNTLTQTNCLSHTTNNGNPPTIPGTGVIKPAAATYVLYCDEIVINGTYTTGIVLNNTNNITLKLFVTKVGNYTIASNLVGGIEFKAEGNFTTTGEKTIILQGSGTPANVREATFTLVSNSLSDFKYLCDASVKIQINIKEKNVLVVQSLPSSFQANWLANKMLTDGINFGNTGKFKMGNVNLTQATAIPTDMSNYDVVVLNGNITIDATAATNIDNYLINKGVVLAFTNNNTSNQNLINKIFNSSAITSVNISLGIGGGDLVSLTNLNDEILNGPFGNASNLFWADDANISGLSNLPLNQITVYSNGVRFGASRVLRGDTQVPAGSGNKLTDLVTGFKHKTKHFIWFGSSNFNGNSSTSTHFDPGDYYYSGFSSNSNYFYLHNNIPALKAMVGSYALDAYNAILSANAFAWAFTIAEYDGIRPQ